MKRLWFVLCLALLPSVASAEPLVKPGERVWLLGDSNGFLLMYELPKLASKDGVLLRGNPVGGASVFWWVQRKHRKHIWNMNAFKPDVVLIVLGTNEAHFPRHVRVNLPPLYGRLMHWAGRGGRRVVWIGPPSLKAGRLRTGADHIREILVATPAPVLDSRQCVFPMWSDGIHPSIPGRKVWARWIWEELTRDGERRRDPEAAESP